MVITFQTVSERLPLFINEISFFLSIQSKFNEELQDNLFLRASDA